MIPRRPSRPSTGAVLASVLIALLFAATFYGWVVMLLVGVLWHTFGVLAPIGFVQALPIGALLWLVLPSGGSK